MYVDSVNAMIKTMLQTSLDGFYYLPSWYNKPKLEMEHLTCFVGGMLTLGYASRIVVDPVEAKEHLRVGEELTRTCYESYKRQASRVGPETFRFLNGGLTAKDKAYNMRPETVESLFYLWRVTKDEKYRNWGWEIFVAIEKNCRRKLGYGGMKDTTSVSGASLNKQESFFLAETLKYLYLLFSDESSTILPLMGLDDERTDLPNNTVFWVFNTEAHPIKTWVEQAPVFHDS
jgi:mannosyl-oligosaccharide alpha-1,2-mannosidase